LYDEWLVVYRDASRIKARRDPNVLSVYLLKCALHYHQHTMAKQMALGDTPIYNSF
jgi:hypothetical protein